MTHNLHVVHINCNFGSSKQGIVMKKQWIHGQNTPTMLRCLYDQFAGDTTPFS